MGFDTVVAAIMVVAVIVLVAYTFLTCFTSIVEYTAEDYKKAVDVATKKLRSDIDILSVNYDNATGILTAYFKNTGEEKYPHFTEFDAIIYGKTDSGETIMFYLTSANYSTVKELINPGIFDPCEVARLDSTLPQPLAEGSYVLLICTSNAVCDSFNFTV